MMDIAPILAALKRSKAGALLVVVQVALTLAIVSNVVSVVAARGALMERPTGTAETQLFAIGFRLTHAEETPALRATDLAAVRAVPGVVDAVASNSYPLRGSGWVEGASTHPGAITIQQQGADAAVYAMDGHAIGTLGLQLLEGRNFRTDEAIEGQFNAPPMPAVAIVSQALAHRLFPSGDALGKPIYLSSAANTPITIVGVVARLQSPAAAGSIDPVRSENSILLPIHATGAGGLLLVRTRPDALEATMPRVRDALIRANPDRLFGRLRPFEDIRADAYRKDRAMALALSVVCLVLILVTALGIVGLTSFWVARRRRQIGIRRALGATARAITGYFLLENALLCSFGVALGLALAAGMNLWLGHRYGIAPPTPAQALACVVTVLALGQLAALVPALRAARVAPVTALRAI